MDGLRAISALIHTSGENDSIQSLNEFASSWRKPRVIQTLATEMAILHIENHGLEKEKLEPPSEIVFCIN